MKFRACVLSLTCCAAVWAQEPAVDPFATPAPMRRAAHGGGRGGGLRGDVSAIASSSTDLPPLGVRALLLMRGRAPAALLEVAGESFLVRAGSKLHVVREGLDFSLEVLEVGAEGVRVRAPDGATVQVR